MKNKQLKNQIIQTQNKIVKTAVGLEMFANNVIKKHLKVETRPYNSRRIRSFLAEKGVKSYSTSDKIYYLPTWEDFKRIVANDWIPFRESLQYKFDYFDCCVPEELAWTYGLFFADGSCSLPKGKGYGGASWRIVNSNKEYLERAKRALEWEYKFLTFKINEFPSYQKGQKTNYGKRGKTLYCLDVYSKKKERIEECIVQNGKLKGKKYRQKRKILKPGARGDFIAEWRYLFYSPIDGKKMVPKPILDEYQKPKIAFLEGAWAGDGYKNGNKKSRYITVSKNNPMAISELGWLPYSMNWSWKIYRYAREFILRYTPQPENNALCMCDDFAYLFAARMAQLYGFNSTGVAYGEVHRNGKVFGHAFSLPLVRDVKTGEFKLYIFDPMYGTYKEFEKDGVFLSEGKEYKVNWVIYF